MNVTAPVVVFTAYAPWPATVTDVPKPVVPFNDTVADAGTTVAGAVAVIDGVIVTGAVATVEPDIAATTGAAGFATVNVTLFVPALLLPYEFVTR